MNFADKETLPTFVSNLSVGQKVRNAYWPRTMVITAIQRRTNIMSGKPTWAIALNSLAGDKPQTVHVDNPDSVRWGLVVGQ